jgi:uncharacterized membrane protein YqjE
LSVIVGLLAGIWKLRESVDGKIFFAINKKHHKSG